jgi:hypothetical protein
MHYINAVFPAKPDQEQDMTNEPKYFYPGRRFTDKNVRTARSEQIMQRAFGACREHK